VIVENTKIAWADNTFNPWVGCTKVSPGCVNCYAERQQARWGNKWGPGVPRKRTSEAYWKKPIKWDNDARANGDFTKVFCASLADVCEDLPELVEMRSDLSVLIERTPHLIWMLLTKRPENFNRLFAQWQGGWPNNVWAGTTAENQEQADKNIPELAKVPAALIFASVEPMLGPVSISSTHCPGAKKLLGWVICGGESGPGARPLHLDWMQDLKNECCYAKVPFFLKHFSESKDPLSFRGGYKNGMPILDGETWENRPWENI
jgi:protein gp37